VGGLLAKGAWQVAAIVVAVAFADTAAAAVKTIEIIANKRVNFSLSWSDISIYECVIVFGCAAVVCLCVCVCVLQFYCCSVAAAAEGRH